MSTFHPFPRLPQELRAHIWSLAAHHRLVHVSWKTRWESGKRETLHVSTPTPPPPAMQVCRESRQHAPYRRAFALGSEPRYIWVNFEIDMICLQDFFLQDLESHKLDIQRLRITAKCGWSSYETFGNWDIDDLRDFPALKEIHVAIDSEVLVWAYTFEERYWGECPRENIKFLDNTSGLILTGSQLWAVSDWGTYFSWDGEGKIRDINNLKEEIKLATDDTHLSLSFIRSVE
ncbi:hypothetical protein GGI35DRAFT_229325 [Trichoderma velutinum]